MEREKLPAACYGVLGGELVYLQPNQPCSPELRYDKGDPTLNCREADRLNALLGVTPSQRAAMEDATRIKEARFDLARQEKKPLYRWGPSR